MGESVDCDQQSHSVVVSGAPMIADLNKFARRLKTSECSDETSLGGLYPEDIDAPPPHFRCLESEDPDVPRVV
jgi:hypothetical protein